MKGKSGIRTQGLLATYYLMLHSQRFGQESIDKMVDWMIENCPASSRPFVLEVGSGNGTLLLSLAEEGYSAEALCGIDYSLDAIKLAELNASQRNVPDLTFAVCDFLHEVPDTLPGMRDLWDVLLDKGTYDAIALGEKDEQGRSPAVSR